MRISSQKKLLDFFLNNDLDFWISFDGRKKLVFQFGIGFDVKKCFVIVSHRSYVYGYVYVCVRLRLCLFLRLFLYLSIFNRQTVTHSFIISRMFVCVFVILFTFMFSFIRFTFIFFVYVYVDIRVCWCLWLCLCLFVRLCSRSYLYSNLCLF